MSHTTEFGPSKGSLVIVGGGMNPEITERFIQLAGEPEVPIVVIPTAESDEEIHSTQETYGVQPLKAAGAVGSWSEVELLEGRRRELPSKDHIW